MDNLLITAKDGKKFTIRAGSYDTVIVNTEWRAYEKRIHLEPNDVWLDVGAHIGAFSCRVGPLVQHVYAFEADPGNFELLKSNLVTNSITNVTASQMAVVGRAGQGMVTFYENQGTNTGLHSLVTKRGRHKIEVPSIGIREVVESTGANKMKIDIEGGEWDVFQHFNQSMFKQIDEIIMEYHFSALRDVDHQKFFKLMKDLTAFYPYANSIPEQPTMKQWTCLIHAWR